MSRFNPIVETQPTCGRAWLTAATKLLDEGPAYGLVLHIDDPVSIAHDEHILDRVDGFLKDHGHQGLQTVANTIFPSNLYRGSAEDLFANYDRAYGRIRRAGGGWGHYFRRLTSWPIGDPRASNADKSVVNQVGNVIEILRRHGPAAQGATRKHVCTMSTFDPRLDMTRFRGRHCLSMIELKPENDGDLLHMTASYRNHFYTTKTLGNLLGLGRLLAFIARETELNVGTLTIHSTHAELETESPDSKTGRPGWRKSDLQDLIDACSSTLREEASPGSVATMEDHTTRRSAT